MKKKLLGTVSYNIHCNFTNYGSALQTWALHQAIKKERGDLIEPILIDYCPDCLLDKDPLNPVKNMWDKDSESHDMCLLSMPAITENFYKFEDFYCKRLFKTTNVYKSDNFDSVVKDYNIDGFVCGSDTIFCINEFGGFDDGFYANYNCMKNGYSFAYAASFGDASFSKLDYEVLIKRLNNFKFLGIRERKFIPFIQEHTNVSVQKVLDPTLLLDAREYSTITANPIYEKKYLLLYARRYNEKMEKFAEKLASSNGWQIVEISLRATNASKHIIRYDAGVEEFLSLIKNSQCVVTNSFHGAIFSMQFERPFYVFSREQCDNKIYELLKEFGLESHILTTGLELDNIDLKEQKNCIDYKKVNNILSDLRSDSLRFLDLELDSFIKNKQ